MTAALLACVASCVGGNVVFGKIPPTTFQFTTVIEHDPGEASGWQVAQVIVLLGRLSHMFPRTAFCQVEVGLPVENEEQGYIPVELAQTRSAQASDRAGRKLLGERKTPTATACELFVMSWNRS